MLLADSSQIDVTRTCRFSALRAPHVSSSSRRAHLPLRARTPGGRLSRVAIEGVVMSDRDALHWEPAPAPAEHARLIVLLEELRQRALRGDALPAELAEKAWEACTAALQSTRQRQQQQLEGIL